MPHMSPPDQVLRVARSLGDTVVDLRHVDPAPAARRGPRPRTLAVIGALCLLVSIIAFARGVAVSADNDAAYKELLAADQVSEFRPRRLGVGHDFLAFGGLAGAIFCFAGALALARAPRSRTNLTIGESDEADLAWDGVACSELVRFDGAGLAVDVPADARATLVIDGLEAEVEGAVDIPAGDRLRVERGPVTLNLEWVPRPRAGQLVASAQIDNRTLKYAGATAAVFGLFLALIWNLPPARGALSADPSFAEKRLVALSRVAKEDALLEKIKERGQNDGGNQSAELASSGLEGDVGDPEAKAKTGKMKIKKVAETRPSISKSRAERLIRNAGALGVLSANRDVIANFTSTDEFTNGLDDATILGGMDGESFNARNGPGGGWGSEVRFSNSPYARDWGTTRVGYLPGGGDTGEDYGPLSGDGNHMRGRRPVTPRVDINVPAGCSVAGCDKEMIRRYIKKQRARFRYCYEKALIRRPQLSGTVSTSFLISGTGKVQGARAGGMDDGELHSCVANVLSSIKFPVVANGDMVSVKYPFHFHSAGR